MAEFSYTAMAPTGQRSTGTVTAQSEREAMALLDARGLFPINITPAKAPTSGGLFRSGRIKGRHMATFYSQLADLLHSGVPLLRSLDILERQAVQASLGQVIREVRAEVADGRGLAEAMAKHPKAFNELAVSMIRAGQEGGFLEDVLKRIAEFTEHQEDLKSKVLGAMAYPIFLAVVGLIVLILLVVLVVPNFKKIFTKLDEQGELPWITKALLTFSDFLIGYWWLILLLFVGGIILFRMWAATEKGRFKLDRWRLGMPGFGKIYLSLAVARFARILGTMLQNGIPILNALRIAKDSTGNKVLSEAIEKSAENLKAGDSLSGPLNASHYFPRDVVEIVAVGEESNSLEKVLLDVASSLEKRTARQLELFVRLLEPVMLLVMAGMVGFVVAALMIPIMKSSMAVQH